MHRIVRILALLSVISAAGCVGNDPDADRATIEQRWTNVNPALIGPYSCITPFYPMQQGWPSAGWCQPTPAWAAPVQTSPWWRVSDCGPEQLPRGTAEISLASGKCVRLWGALNPVGSYWDFDIVGAFGWRNIDVGGNRANQITGFLVAHDTQVQFCTGPMSAGNPCQPANPPNIPVTAIRTESSEVSGTLNPILKVASIQVGTW